jgi:hypothetical protein
LIYKISLPFFCKQRQLSVFNYPTQSLQLFVIPPYKFSSFFNQNKKTMKQFFMLAAIPFLLIACNNADNKTVEPAKTEDKTTTEVKLPIPLEMPYRNWEMGSTDNVVAGMNYIKAYIDKDDAALAAATGDSIQLDFDLYQAKLTRDSALKIFAVDRAKYSELKVTMYDYVSVVSGDKTQEWVTYWYKQSWKDAKGVADSMSVVDDLRFEKGKVVELSEKTSRFQKN